MSTTLTLDNIRTVVREELERHDRIVERLREYARHDPDCPCSRFEAAQPEPKCNCGYDALMADLGGAK